MADTLTSPELDEIEGTLKDRRLKLAKIFEEAGPTKDMRLVKSLDGDTMAKVEQIRTLDEECQDLAKKARKLQEMIEIGNAVLDNEPLTREAKGQRERGDEQHVTKAELKSLGTQITSQLKAAGINDFKRFRLELADVDLKTLMTTSAGWAPDVVRGPRVVDFATRPLEILDMIPTTRTNQIAVAYMEETTFTNAAAERNEGAAKAESALALTERTSSVRSIATTLPVTDEQFEDIDRIEAYLNNRLPFFVRQRVEGQFLVGNGTAPNLRGLLNTSGIQTQAKGTDPTPDAVYKAMVLVMTTGAAQPDLAIFNPLDWQDIALLRTADGIYIWGSPQSAQPKMIWGVPVALSQALTQNTGVVGAFRQFSEIAVKKDVTVERGYVNDDFSKDQSTLRAEMRAAFIFYRPAAFCTITGI